jgi:hypothetical protein
MRSHTARFSSSLKNTQLLTSAAVRPQPWQISSNSVEQMPMQGLSGRSDRPVSAALVTLSALVGAESGALDGKDGIWIGLGEWPHIINAPALAAGRTVGSFSGVLKSLRVG